MNQPIPHSVVCASCGKTSTQSAPPESLDWEAVDLDTRPAEPLRSALHAWLQSCPACFYCASDLSQSQSGLDQAMQSDGFLAIERDEELTETTRRFLRRSELDEAAGDLAAAGWQALFAAWGADDAEQPEVACRCRLRAGNCLQAAVALNQPLADQPGDGEAVLVDIFRRAGLLAEAGLAAQRAQEQFPDPLLQRLLQYQLALIAQADTARHTSADVAAD